MAAAVQQQLISAQACPGLTQTHILYQQNLDKPIRTPGLHAGANKRGPQPAAAQVHAAHGTITSAGKTSHHTFCTRLGVSTSYHSSFGCCHGSVRVMPLPLAFGGQSQSQADRGVRPFVHVHRQWSLSLSTQTFPPCPQYMMQCVWTSPVWLCWGQAGQLPAS